MEEWNLLVLRSSFGGGEHQVALHGICLRASRWRGCFHHCLESSLSGSLREEENKLHYCKEYTNYSADKNTLVCHNLEFTLTPLGWLMYLLCLFLLLFGILFHLWRGPLRVLGHLSACLILVLLSLLGLSRQVGLAESAGRVVNAFLMESTASGLSGQWLCYTPV